MPRLTMKGDNMKTILSAAIGAMLALSVMEAGAQSKIAERKIELTIEQQSLADALNEWAKQTGLQLVSSSSEMMNTTVAPQIMGAYTAQGALEELLKGTTLTYEWVSDRAVAIREKPLVVPAALKSDELDQKQATVPIARFSSEAWREQQLAANDPGTRSGSSSAGGGMTPNAQDRQELEEILVTGTHIRGVTNNTIPTTVLDKRYIDSTGISTTTALIESVPQNFALASQAGISVPGVSGGREQGSGVNFRALGEGTTLVLLNGRRLPLGFEGSAVDISALPLSALERVEILTDGASALYGSDAIGGVVNFILRRDFEGAETRLRSGWADGNVNEHRLTQTMGNAWGSGNALLSLEYYKRDLLLASERDFVPDTSIIGSLFPQDESYSVVLSGVQDLAETVSVFADAIYFKRDSENRGGQTPLSERNSTENPQLSVAAGLEWQVGAAWQIEASGSYAQNKLEQRQDSGLFVDFGLGAFLLDSRFEIEAVRLKADGPVLELPGGQVRVAVGADWRSESFEFASAWAIGGTNQDGDLRQNVRSAFGELYVPIVSPANSLTGVHRLDLSVAGRFDDYSTFGSSFDPRFGAMWEPVRGLRLRGSYGTSYKAPKLTDYNLAVNGALAYTDADPLAPTGFSRLLEVGGTNVRGLAAQEAETATFGLEFTPSVAPQLQLGVNYYSIRYRNQIANPPGTVVMLGNPASFGSLIIRDPSVAQVNDAIAIGELGQGFFAFDEDFNPDENFDPTTVDVVVDIRRRNLSVVRTKGFDISLRYGLDLAGGEASLGLSATHILELEHQVTRTSDPFDTVDTFYNPPDWRARGYASWQRESWATNLFVNHADAYVDNRAIAPSRVSSYTTVDLRVAYDCGKHFKRGALSGLVISANIQNLFDRDPPRTAIIDSFRDMGFDPTNANPMGRFVALEFAKTW